MRKLLLGTMDFPPTTGGVQSVLAAFVATTGFEVRVVAPSSLGDAQADSGLPAVVRRVPKHGRVRTVIALSRAMRSEARSFSPDVILCGHVAAALRLRGLGIPVVVIAHGAELLGPRMRRIARVALRGAARVIAVSHFTRDQALALGVRPERCVVIANGAPAPRAVADAEKIAIRRRIAGGGRVLLTVARLQPHKGIDDVIATLPVLPRDVTYVVVGEGPDRARLEGEARRYGVTHRVRFVGRLDEAELAAAYGAADLFVLASRAESGSGVEGFGLVLLEAAAYGVPVVATRSGGIPDAVEDGVSGILVRSGDRAELASTLDGLFSDPVGARRLGEAGRVLAASSRSWRAVVERYDAVLTEVIAATQEARR